jgi:hypothetical protein
MRHTFFSGLFALVAAGLFSQAVTASDIVIEASYVRPTANFSSYDKFLIRPLDISDARVIPPPWVEGEAGKQHPWKISEKNARFFQQTYYDAMRKQLEELGGYTLVTEPTANAIEVEIEIISLTPYAKPKDKVITKGSGEMTIRANIRDSLTGNLLVIYEGDTQVGQDYQEFTEYTIDQNLQALFSSWGEYLRLALDKEKGKH